MFAVRNLYRIIAGGSGTDIIIGRGQAVVHKKTAKQTTVLISQWLRGQSSKMPKKSSGGKGAAAKEGTAASSNSASKSPIQVGKDGDISIAIQVRPGAKTDAITDISEEAVGVQISAPPVDGEANTAIVKYFAEVLKLKKADVSLRGGKSRQKTVSVSSSAGLTPDNITALLEAERQQR